MNSCSALPVEENASNEHLEEKTDAPLSADCPVSKTTSSKVHLRTVRRLVREERRWQLGTVQYYFCADPKCPVVYFSNDPVPYFIVDDLEVKVFAKDLGEDVPVCYCFGWTRGRIHKEIRETGRSTAPVEIAKQVKAGLCACDVKNPKGRCCLGDVNAVVKNAITAYSRTRM